MPYPRFRISAPPGEISFFLRDAVTGVSESVAADFAGRLREWTGVEKVILTGSGRSAFRLMLQSLDLPPGAEIVFPAYTFHPMPVTAAALGFQPVFADVEPDTWNLDPASLAERVTVKTRVVVPTHLFGLPADMEAIMSVAREKELVVIEDCAHALGATREGRPAGSWGQGAVFTFAPSKNLPCWGGGAAAVNELGLAKKLETMTANGQSCSRGRVLKDQLFNLASWLFTGKVFFPWTLYPLICLADRLGKDWFDRPFLEAIEPVRFLGSDKKMAINVIAPIQAAAGLRQLKRFPRYLARQVKNAHRLRAHLADCPGIDLQKEPEGTNSSFLYVRVRVENPVRFREELLRRGVDTKPDDMRDCSMLGIFGDQPPCPNAARLGGHCIELPCSPFYSEKEIDDIAGRVLKAAEKYRNQ